MRLQTILSAKTPVQNMLPAKPFFFDLMQLCHGRIAVLATVAVSIPVLTPKGSGATDFFQTILIADILMLVHQMSPERRDARIRFDVRTERTT